MGNYHALFDLYLNAPNMGAYIMDHFIDRERVKALMVMTKACAVLLLFYANRNLTFALSLPTEYFLMTVPHKQIHDSEAGVHFRRARLRSPRSSQGFYYGAPRGVLQESKQLGRREDP